MERARHVRMDVLCCRKRTSGSVRFTFEAIVQARDPKPQRPLGADAGLARPAAGLRKNAVPGIPIRPDMRPLGYPARGRVVAPPPRLPVFTHSEPSTRPQRYTGMPAARGGFGLPNLRRNVCPHFYMTGSRGAIPIQAPHLLKALIRQEQNVSRCQLRGGVHLEQGYVNDVCLTPRFNQCVFYEDDLTKD